MQMYYTVFLRASLQYWSRGSFINPLPDDKILDCLQTTILYLMKIAKKFSKRVENTVGKEEIPRYEQFLLYPQCFQQKACFPGAAKGATVWEWVKYNVENCRNTSFLFNMRS